MEQTGEKLAEGLQRQKGGNSYLHIVQCFVFRDDVDQLVVRSLGLLDKTKEIILQSLGDRLVPAVFLVGENPQMLLHKTLVSLWLGGKGSG